VCFCSAIKPVQSKTRVVFIQHPLEAKVPISTCRMAHLSLPNSELHVGLIPEEQPKLREALAAPGTALLFPADDATDVTELKEPPKTLVVVDGTWDNARKLFQQSPLLRSLPRIGFRPDKPGNYRIRKEPADHCLATIEATAYVLEKLEHAPGRFTPMLHAFDFMVERQLEFIQKNFGPSRYTRNKPKRQGPHGPLAPLIKAWPNAVLLFGESNAWPRDANLQGYAELLQLVAVRPATNERFDVLLKPKRELSPVAPRHLGLDEAQLAAAVNRDEALARWRAFQRPDDVWVGWGRYVLDLLAADGEPLMEFLDLRVLSAKRWARPAGGVEELAGTLGNRVQPAARAARRLHAIEFVARQLISLAHNS
jgi:DTW domain-containing protein